MLFNSFEFLLFLPIVFMAYWFIPFSKLKGQNLLLLVASYFFYACWDWRFLFLLMFSTLLDYYTGIRIYEATNQRSKLFWASLSITVNLGFLGIFKYYNFFAESFADGLSLLGIHSHWSTLRVILPVGISFYTFHGLSYVLDLYNKRIKPEKDVINYSVFVCFFPLLVAGPIERATHLLPQIIKKREFNYIKMVDGMRQILWGLFKKIVIADNCAKFVDEIFSNYSDMSGSMLIIGAFLFAFQIYCDFSGYSDIALGTARLFGIELLRNFAFPYFSRDIAEFWRRWHISLTTWFRDYLYIPLGGSRGGTWMKIRNTFIIFLVSGFWHGANWTFLVWGLLNAIYFLPYMILGQNRKNIENIAKEKLFPSLKEGVQILSTFCLTLLAWIFFRAENVNHALQFIHNIFSSPFFSATQEWPKRILIYILFLLMVEWIQRDKQHALQFDSVKLPTMIRWAIYIGMVLVILVFGNFNKTEFIYFAF